MSIIEPGTVTNDGVEHIIKLRLEPREWNNKNQDAVRDAIEGLTHVLGCVIRHNVPGQFRVVIRRGLKSNVHQKLLKQIVNKCIELKLYSGTVEDALPRPMIT